MSQSSAIDLEMAGGLAPADVALGHEIDRLIAATGMTAGRVAQRLEVSESALSRYRHGTARPTDKTLLSLCDLAKVRSDTERLRLLGLLGATRDVRLNKVSERQQAAGTPDDAEAAKTAGFKPAQRPTTRVGGRDSQPRLTRSTTLLAVVAGLVLFGAGTGFGWWLWHGHPAARQANTIQPAASPTTPPCSRYQVTAQDLWLRDAQGAKLGPDPTRYQLRHDQKVTVQRWQDSAGKGNWYITADDGRSGWVDPVDHLTRLCADSKLNAGSPRA